MWRCSVKRRCAAGRLVRSECGEVCISVEVFVEPHRLVHLTAGRALMVLLQQFQDDRVPVHVVRIAVSGQLSSGDCR
jgi:hypothetical protein